MFLHCVAHKIPRYMSTCTGEAGNPIRPSSFAPWESRGFMQLKQFYSIHSDYFPLLYIISMLTENFRIAKLARETE